MASAPPTIDVDQEVLCPICKDYLTDPVTLDCGHNFCQGCIVKHCVTWEEKQVGDLECPVCRVKIQKGNFRPNWQLAYIVEKIKFLALNNRLEDLCKTHMEKLHLFCKEDEELVCLVCQQSPEHEGHTVVLKDKAAQECKKVICGHLEHLRKEKERFLAYEAETRKESNSLLKLTETERQNTVDKFRQLHQLLEEREKSLLNKIEEMEEEITRRMDEHLAGLSKEISSLERIIQEMEEKIQQPASELLQDVKRTLERCQQRKTFKNPMTFLQKLKRWISEFCVKNPILYVGMKIIKDILPFGWPQKANVTLDPDTAHPELILSEDRKSVRLGNREQDLPDKPEKLSDWPCVLGQEGFKAGRHFWEVTVGSKGEWAVGVAKKSVRSKSLSSMRDFLLLPLRLGLDLPLHLFLPLLLLLLLLLPLLLLILLLLLPFFFQPKSSICDINPEGGIWAVRTWKGEILACTSPPSLLLPLRRKPKRIRVTLDYEKKCVSFSDADSGAEFYTFSGASFSGETLLPFFLLWGDETHLRIS